MTDKKRIFIDVDDVIFKFVDAWVDLINMVHNTTFTLEDINEWAIDAALKRKSGLDINAKALLEEYKITMYSKTNAQWEAEGGPQIIADLLRLKSKYEIYFTTACPAYAATIRLNWFRKFIFPTLQLPEDRLNFIYDKSILSGFAIIDDREDNLLSHDIKYKFLMKKPWNKNSKLAKSNFNIFYTTDFHAVTETLLSLS